MRPASRDTLLRTLSSALIIAVLAGCSAPPTGSLEIHVSNVPGGAVVAVNVSGPNGYSVSVDGSLLTVLSGLPVGNYTVTGSQARVTSATGEGDERFAAAPVPAIVTAGSTAQAFVNYAYAGLNVSDPANDAVSLGGTPSEYIYDIVEVWTEKVGAALLVHLELREDMTDTSLFIGQLFIDADQNDATGSTTNVDLYCTIGSFIGAEFFLAINGPSDPTSMLTWPGQDYLTDVGRSDSGSTVTLSIPLVDPAGSARWDVEAVIGNTNEPTDCLLHGAATL